MYAYLFAHNAIRQENIITFLNNTEEIEHWAKCLPFAFLLVSKESASELSRIFREEFGMELKFIILDADTDRNGWLGKGSWDVIRNPEKYSKKNRVNRLLERVRNAIKERK